MLIARRVYLYMISLISLMMVLVGASNLLRLLGEILIGTAPARYEIGDATYRRDQFSLWGAMLLVGAVVWAIHWLFAQRSVDPTNPAAPEERLSVLRKLFLYGVLATALAQIAGALADLGRLVLRAPPSTDGRELALGLNALLTSLLVYGLAGAYYWRVRNQDNARTPETGRAATVRRWYVYLVSYVALSVAVFQVAALARTIWQVVTGGFNPWPDDPQWIPFSVASALAWIAVAGGIWLLHWMASQRRVAATEDEQRSALRKVYLYGMTLQTVAVTLGSAAYFLYNLLRVFWGTDPLAGSGESLLTAAGNPLLTGLVYGVFWAYHWRVIEQEARLPATSGRVQAAIRQIYHYLVALLGLGMLAGGVMDLLRLLLDGGLGGSATNSLTRQAWGDQISFVATLIIVGAPVWVINWLHVQREALAPDGSAARQALPRRLYLFLTLFLTVTTLLSSTAWLIYQVLRNFGEPALSWVSDMSWALATTITAGILLAYHVYVLVGDLQARKPGQEPIPVEPGTAPALLLLRSDDAAALSAAITILQTQQGGNLRVDRFAAPGLSPGEVRDWLAGRNEAQPTPLRRPPQPGPAIAPSSPG